jgi:2-C-methyl-D-erythritol 4-phosphate cytidylyltransferase
VGERGLHMTDEVSALQETGIRVKFVESRHPNLKITTPADLALAEALMK